PHCAGGRALEPELQTAAPPDARARLQPFVRWESGLAIAAVGVIVLGVLSSPQFLTSGNLFYLCISVGEVAVMTLPLTFIVITGEIDLSVASTLGLSSALVRHLWGDGWAAAGGIPA